MRSYRHWLLALLLFGLAAVALVTACKDSEQGRTLFHTKGVYSGPKEPPLTEAQLSALRDRASRQGSQPGLGGGVPCGRADVRAPSMATSTTLSMGGGTASPEALRQRAGLQAGTVGTGIGAVRAPNSGYGGGGADVRLPGGLKARTGFQGGTQ